MSIANFTLTSAVTQTAAPFTIGHAFKKGDVPSGTSLVGSVSTLQVIPKNYWTDGSLKFAVISGKADLVSNTALTVNLNAGTPTAGTALTTTDLKNTGITATVDAGTFGSASWSGTDFDTPWQSWISGSVMSSWIYRKPIGTDPHLVAFLEIRLYAGGNVNVLPWVENGYLMVASPTNKQETFTFTLNGVQQFSSLLNFYHHTRSPLISGTALSYWTGTDPQITPRNDVAYLQKTELVPTYGATTSSSSLSVLTASASYTPFQVGGFSYDSDYMGSSGFQWPIGLLPTHDAAYLVCNDNPSLVYGAVVRNGYGAGRYCIHYRDETTNRPIRFSQYPQLALGSGSNFKDYGATNGPTTPATTGGGRTWDTAHCPSVGYLAYLLTGRWYFMEEVQFAAGVDYLGHGATAVLRDGSKGLVKPEAGAWQTRSCAWAWRNLTQALCVTPDDDTTLRNEYITSVTYNIDYFYNMYVAQANNPFGFIRPGEVYSSAGGTGLLAAWQQDFVTAAFGYSVCMDLPVTSAESTKLQAFFQWKAKSAVFKLGTSDKFWYVNGAPYNIQISTATNPDYTTGTGPWYTNESDIYQATYYGGNVAYPTPPTYMSSTEGVLGAEYTSDAWGKSMWGNIEPAIAYAVRFNVPGAQAAYNRMIGATNYSAIQTTFNSSPVWDIVPPTTTQNIGVIMGKTMRFDSLDFLDGYMVCDDGCNGVLASEIPLTGDNGGSLLANDIIPGDVSTHEYSVEILSQPSAGQFFCYDDGSISFTGAPPGTYTGGERVKIDGVASDTTYSMTVGSSTATVTSVSVSPTAPSVTGGTTQTFTATVVGTNSPSQAVTWLASAGSITSGGVFTAPAATSSVQTINVTATSVLDTSKSGVATVTVPASVVPTVTSVTVSPASVTVSGSATQTFTTTVIGTNSPSQSVTWTASAGSITSGGVFTAPAATTSTQTITITARSTVDTTKTGTATVTIAAVIPTVTSVVVSPTAPSVAGGTTQTFTANVIGTNSPSQTVAWTTTAGSITSGGVFTAPASTTSVQTITVTATSTVDGTKSGTATVTVPAVTASPTVTTVVVSPASVSVSGGATQTFTATVIGSNSPSQTVTWSASAGTINSSGLFTAPAATNSDQVITITGTSTVDNTKSGTAAVTVLALAPVPTVSSVVIYPGSATVIGGRTQSFTATVTGANSPSQAVTWTASAGTIDGNGLFTAPAATVDPQDITVSATSVLDTTKTSYVSVTVPALSPVHKIFRKMFN